jgi:hypothetical protein
MTTQTSAQIRPTAGDAAFAGLAALQAALFLVPLVVLGQAIGWPASLRLPADEILPLIAAHPAAVQAGYAAYLLVSLALIPFALALRLHANRHGVEGLLVDCAAALGVASGVLKMLGIVRWLSAMPALAELQESAADAAARQAVAAVYVGLNGYAGAVGELLGVQLVGGLFLVAAGRVLALCGLTRLGLAGSLIGLLFVVTAGRIALPALGAAQSIAVPLALLWFTALAVALRRRA